MMAKFFLSGWQRLWVLLSSVYFFIVAAMTAIMIPEVSFILSVSLDELPKPKRNELSIRAKSDWGYDPGEDISFDMIDTKDGYLIMEALDSKHSETGICVIKKWNALEPGTVMPCDSLYQISWEKLTTWICIAVISWLLPVVFIYIFGMAVAWVFAGFRNPG